MADTIINKPEKISFLDYELSDLINKLLPLAECGYGAIKWHHTEAAAKLDELTSF